MAKITKGYPFAFQVLGYYTFENGGSYEKALDGLSCLLSTKKS